MRALKSPLLLATLGVMVAGMLTAQSLYWLRVGNKGISYTETDRQTLSPAEAKPIVTGPRFNLGKEYDPGTDYNIDILYMVTVKRDIFPFTSKERVQADIPVLKWIPKTK